MKKTILGWTYGVFVGFVGLFLIEPHVINTDIKWGMLRVSVVITLGLLGILAFTAEAYHRELKFIPRYLGGLFIGTDGHHAFSIENPWEFDREKYVAAAFLEGMQRDSLMYEEYVNKFGENWKPITASKGYRRYKKRHQIGS